MIRFVGANPGLTLFRDNERVAFVSVWRADWTPLGAGDALVVWHANRVRVLTEHPALGRWLADEFTRHFPEVEGLPWPAPDVETTPVRLELDPARGLRAAAGDVVAEITAPMAMRPIRVDAFALGETANALSNVYVPCREGRLTIGGDVVDGAPEVEENRPSSSAFLALAEVWSD